MSYELSPGEPIPEGVTRIAGEQLDRILAHLTGPSARPSEQVHEIRKRFKEMRALLRLARFALGPDFAFENEQYRDAGRSLAAARDAQAARDAVKKLRLASRDDDEIARLTAAQRAVDRAQRNEVRDASQAAMTRIGDDLRLFRSRITVWPAMRDDFAELRPGFQRTYADGRRAMRAAIARPEPPLFHALRKRVKDHWYHAQLLRRASCELQGRMAALQQLSRELGDHHDLAMLEEEIAAGRLLVDSDRRVADCVVGAAQRRRAQLERSAIACGSMLYAEKPSRLATRIERAWVAAAAGGGTAV